MYSVCDPKNVQTDKLYDADLVSNEETTRKRWYVKAVVGLGLVVLRRALDAPVLWWFGGSVLRETAPSNNHSIS